MVIYFSILVFFAINHFCALSQILSICFLAGPVLYVLDVCNWFLYKVSPICAVGVALISVYWTFVTYGAITVMQVRTVFSRVRLSPDREKLANLCTVLSHVNPLRKS